MSPDSRPTPNVTPESYPLTGSCPPPPHATPDQLAAHWAALREARARQLAPFAMPRPQRVYSVPRRFNILSIMVLTTLFAVGFAALRYCNAPLPVYLYVGVQATITLGVQMFWPNAPRTSSVISGALLLPLTLIGAFLIEVDGRRPPHPLVVLCPLPFVVGGGMFVGYVMGVFAAGVFLIVDKLEVLLRRKPSGAAASPSSPFGEASFVDPVTAELASPTTASTPSPPPESSPSDPVPPT
ncbi:MAG: hypothetical protein U0939_21315 [Pirellulales bacterium]